MWMPIILMLVPQNTHFFCWCPKTAGALNSAAEPPWTPKRRTPRGVRRSPRSSDTEVEGPTRFHPATSVYTFESSVQIQILREGRLLWLWGGGLFAGGATTASNGHLLLYRISATRGCAPRGDLRTGARRVVLYAPPPRRAARGMVSQQQHNPQVLRS